MKKMSVDEAELLSQLHRWRDETEKRLKLPGLSHLLTKPVATAFGWCAVCEVVVSKRM